MYTVSFWRPWPTFILRTDAGRKDCENRTRPPPKAALGRRIALHAGKTYDLGKWPRVLNISEECSTGIVGTALLAGYLDCRTLNRAVHVHDPGDRQRVYELDRSEWWSGPVGLLLVEPRTLREPVPLKGQQGWWRLTEEMVALVADLEIVDG